MAPRKVKDHNMVDKLRTDKHDISKEEGKTIKIPFSKRESKEGDVFVHIEKENAPKDLDDLVVSISANSKKEKEEKGKFPKKYVAIAAIPIVLLLGLGSCQHTDKVLVEHRETQMVELYQGENPAAFEHYFSQAAGQEEEIAGTYDGKVQEDREKSAISNFYEWNESEDIIQYNMNILGDKEASQEDIQQAIGNLTVEYKNRVDFYEAVKTNVEKSANDFEKASDLEKDDMTYSETQMIEQQKNKYHEDSKLEKENSNTMSKMNNGHKKENIKVDRQKDGDYSITYDDVTQTVETRTTRGIKAAIENIKDLFKGKNVEKSNIEKNNETKNVDDLVR